MYKVNQSFLKLNESYLFSEIARKIESYKAANPSADIIRMGIGDVTRPLAPAVIEAMQKAVSEQASAETFRGYGPEQGYEFLRNAISENDYKARGIEISPDEIFVSDGAKSDTANISDILGTDNVVALTDPVYPVYLDSNIMAGRAGDRLDDGAFSRIVYLPCTADNDFVPQLPSVKVDIIYLCYPNNPTGTTLTRQQLKVWVDYAAAHGALIMFDSAYKAFITDPDVPHSIYEIEGAEEVAIEFRSYSKTAGFTGLRCGYTVVPKALKAVDQEGNPVSINRLWNRRQCTKFNGASYIAQRAAEAIYSPAGKAEIQETVNYYLRNARLLRENLSASGLKVWGGVNAPYVWVKSPDGLSSWQFFDKLLTDYQIATTPGVGFGPAGEGYIRLTAFGSYENTLKAVDRLRRLSIK